MKRVMIIFAIGMLFLGACSSNEMGKVYESYNDFIQDQQARGFVLIGKFGDDWPAKVVSSQTAKNEISFEVKNGGPQNYSGFEGYELKVVRLDAGNNRENVIVFRSKDKK